MGRLTRVADKQRVILRWAFATGNLLVAGMFIFLALGALPARYWLVDGMIAILAAALVIATVALVRKTPRWIGAGQVALAVVLAFGLVLFAALVIGAAFLRGVTGVLSARGVGILLAVLALELPYLVAYPGLQLLWLRRHGSEAR